MNCGPHRDDRRTPEQRRADCGDCIEVKSPAETLPLMIGGVIYDLPEPVFNHIITLQLWVEKKHGQPIDWRALELHL